MTSPRPAAARERLLGRNTPVIQTVNNRNGSRARSMSELNSMTPRERCEIEAGADYRCGDRGSSYS
jgi:hypothetical protein